MSTIGEYLAKHFGARAVGWHRVPTGNLTIYAVADKVIPVVTNEDGISTVFIAPLVGSERDMHMVIDDYLKDCARRIIPISAFKGSK